MFCVTAGYGDLVSFRALALELGTDRPFYACQPSPEVPRDAGVEALARHYTEAIRRVQPRGPYHLCGYSAGGLVAFEMAQQLVAAGERVAFVGLLDSPAKIGTKEWLFYTANREVMGRSLALAERMGSRLARVMYFVARDLGLAQHLEFLRGYEPRPFRIMPQM